MKTGYFARLAMTNIGKNRRLYIPQMITGICLVAVMYILTTLCLDENIRTIKGGDYIPTIMQIGVVVMTILSVIMLLYTNSFLMKQRKREYGLYNVLGMGKKHIARIMLHENTITAVVVLAGGLLSGIVLYKLCTLFICKIMKVDSDVGYSGVDGASSIRVLLIFAGIFLVNYIWNLIQLARLKPVELMQSTHTGEKEPKTKWILALLGVVCLGAGYYIALSVESPLRAINSFFGAVLLVVVGTYFVFIAGIIVLLKLFKKNKRFYYHPKHMTAVSGLVYRMKQNAVGLASICILSTCVLVMVSTTLSLYVGMQDMLDIQFPQDLAISASCQYKEGETYVSKDLLEEYSKLVEQQMKDAGIEIEKKEEQSVLSLALMFDGDKSINAEININGSVIDNVDHYFQTECISLEEYKRLTKDNLKLTEDEVAIFEPEDNALKLPNDIALFGKNYKVVSLSDFPTNTKIYSTINVLGLVVPDQATIEWLDHKQAEAYAGQNNGLEHRYLYHFAKGTTKKSLEKLSKADIEIEKIPAVKQIAEEVKSYSYEFNLRYSGEKEIYALYGSLLFLGLLLGLVFVFATVLIIYYKQISEGYEDRNRFQIMLKVGMSKKEVKRTIKDQIVLVFVLPLVVAAIHIAVAFPILTKILEVLFLPRTLLFLLCVIGTFVIFSIVYVLIYTLTAKMYYKIVVF